MTKKIRQPNPIKLVGYMKGYSGYFNVHPYNFDLESARKAHEWLGRVIKFLEQKSPT